MGFKNRYSRFETTGNHQFQFLLTFMCTANIMLMKADLKVTLTIDQILDLIRQLPTADKIKVGKELEKELIESRLTKLLEAFETDEISEEDIGDAVEEVREERYKKYRRH